MSSPMELYSTHVAYLASPAIMAENASSLKNERNPTRCGARVRVFVADRARDRFFSFGRSPIARVYNGHRPPKVRVTTGRSGARVVVTITIIILLPRPSKESRKKKKSAQRAGKKTIKHNNVINICGRTRALSSYIERTRASSYITVNVTTSVRRCTECHGNRVRETRRGRGYDNESHDITNRCRPEQEIRRFFTVFFFFFTLTLR